MNKNNAQKFARLISTIFIPPIFTLVSFIFLSLTYEGNLRTKISVIAIASVFGVILQIASFIYFYRKGILTDVDAKIKDERTLPYFISIIIFNVGFILLLIFKVSSISIAFWFCYISNTFLVILINKYMKISIHVMGISGPLALFTFLFGFKMFMFLPILVLVAWSRIKLKCHSLAEVVAGGLLGFISVYFQLSLFLI